MSVANQRRNILRLGWMAWGGSLLRDARFACRSLRRAPFVAVTIVLTVGLGLGLIAAVFTMLNAVVFQTDAVPDPESLYAVVRPAPADVPSAPFTRAEYETLLRETEAFVDAFAAGPSMELVIDGERMEGTFVSGNFFEVLGVSAAHGRALTPADERNGERTIVLSHRAWSRYFGSDAGVLSRTVDVNGAAFQVVGVTPQAFRGLATVPPDFWVPLALLGELRGGSVGGELSAIVGRLQQGVAPGEALAQLVAWDVRRAAETSAERPAADLMLEPRRGTVPLTGDTIAVFMPLFFAFGLILVIDCANVANLLLARGVARQRELGVRVAIGASRRRIASQLLTESLLLAFAAAALGFGVSRLVLEAVVYYLTTAWANLGDIRLAVPAADWRVALFLVVAAIAATAIFALAPALQAARVDLVQPLRGEVVRNARPGRVRNGLVALQVAGSALLLVCAAVFLRSSLLASTVDPGLRTADTVLVSFANEQRRAAVLDALSSDPAIESVAASAPVAMTARAEGATGRPAATIRFVSPELFDVLGVEVTAGRGFEPNERDAAAAVAVVSESSARALWPGAPAVGQILRIEADAPAGAPRRGGSMLPRVAVVVGVARNVPGFRVGGQRMLAGPDVYLPTAADSAGTSLALRVRGDPLVATRAIRARLAAIEPGLAEVMPLQELARMEGYLLEIPFRLTLVLGSLALFLTLTGLFSVLSHLVEQRTREIGVRIALGATRRRIAALVLSQSARPVGIGLLVGAALPAALGAALLATPAAALIGQTVRLFDPAAYAASLLCVLAACAFAALAPVLRAGRVDPMSALRRD